MVCCHQMQCCLSPTSAPPTLSSHCPAAALAFVLFLCPPRRSPGLGPSCRPLLSEGFLWFRTWYQCHLPGGGPQELCMGLSAALLPYSLAPQSVLYSTCHHLQWSCSLVHVLIFPSALTRKLEEGRGFAFLVYSWISRIFKVTSPSEVSINICGWNYWINSVKSMCFLK